MATRGRPVIYTNEEQRPVTISLRIPHDLAAQAKRYAYKHRQSVTELLLDGLKWRLEQESPRWQAFTPYQYDSNTALQEMLTPVYAIDQGIPYDGEDGGFSLSSETLRQKTIPPPPSGPREPSVDPVPVPAPKATTSKPHRQRASREAKLRHQIQPIRQQYPGLGERQHNEYLTLDEFGEILATEHGIVDTKGQPLKKGQLNRILNHTASETAPQDPDPGA